MDKDQKQVLHMMPKSRTVTVFLDQDYDADELERILAALQMVKGVAAVEPRGLASIDYMARRTASLLLRERALDALSHVFDESEILR
jgi:hypothetical protein